VDLLLGDPTKAREAFGWTPEISLAEMIEEMVRHDLAEAEQEMMVRAG
jgi:GDPmannose 4,6-dehydratase